MLMALIGIAIYDYKIMRADTLALSKGVINNLQSRIETEVAAYLAPIRGVIRFSRDLLTNRKFQEVRVDLVEPLAIGILENTPQITSLIIGNPAGEFFMLRRYQDGAQHGLETKWIRKPGGASGKPVVTLTRRDAEGNVLSDGSVPWDGYDPRARPWYEGANEARTLFWTDVYPFFTDRAAGITGSIPYVDAAGNLVAVVGADVKLESLSRFLGDLVIGKTGLAFIVDDAGRVIAHPKAELLKQDAAGELRLTRVADLGDPVVGRAFDRYRVEGHGRRDFELNGRRYISSASSLNHLLQRNWSIIVVVPEDDFVGFVVENVGKTLGMGLAVLALAALLAALVIRQGLRADRDATRILERQAQLDAQGEAFGTLATQSTLFETGRPETLAPVTEAAARSSRVRRASLWRLAPGKDALVCVDCFDQDTEGHTQGAVLSRSEHPGLFGVLEGGETFSDVDVARDARLASLHSSYLLPLGCRALLSAPIAVHGEVKGALWLEDGSRRTEWPAQVARFARAIANLMAIREAAGSASAPAPARLDAPVASVPPIVTRASPTERGSIDPGLGTRRAAAFTAKLAKQAGDAGVASAGVIDRLPVLSLRFTDAAALAEPIDHGSKETAIGYLIRELEAAASSHGLAYLKFLTDQVVAAVDPQEDVDQGAQRLADFALAVQATCERLFAAQRAALAFRIGIDIGPVIGSVVGREQRSFNLWGEAVQMAGAMADTSLPGAIQTTESVYQMLGKHYLFQLRGHHYLEGVGEFSTYLLSGRL